MERLYGDAAEATAVVSRLFVAPGARGHGLGAALMERATEEARRRGPHPVLDVVSSDRAAATPYARLGRRLPATVEQRWGADRDPVTIRCYAAATS